MCIFYFYYLFLQIFIMYIHTIILNDLKPSLKFTLLLLSFVLSCINSYSQNFELKIYSKDSINKSVIDTIAYKTLHLNKKSVYNEIESVSNILSLKGFIYNSFILEEKDSLIFCSFNLNRRIDIIRLYFNDINLEESFLKTISKNIQKNYFEIPTSKIQLTLKLISSYIESKGYSFVKVSLNKLSLSNNIITAKLNIDLSNRRTVDKVIIKGYTDFPKKYLTRYLGLKENTIFKTNLLKETQENLNTIPFITQIKNPEVLFTKDSTTLYLYLKKKSISQFDGVIGFSNSKNDNTLKVNGYINLFLNNIFNTGENIRLNWINNGNEKTTLNLNVITPYIYRSKISTSGSFNIYKQDSSYINTTTELKIKFNIDRNQSIGSIFNIENSNISSTLNINNFQSFKKTLFGLSYNYRPLILEDKNHFSLEIEYLTGKKNTNHLKNNNNKAYFFAQYLFHLNPKNKILFKSTAELINTSEISENELYRIGGINSIRGFEDQSILASKYTVTNIEYQFHTNETNYLYTITDFAYTNNNYIKSSNNLIGIGLGYNFKNQNTNINISYALGKTKMEVFKFNNTKLHIKVSYYF